LLRSPGSSLCLPLSPHHHPITPSILPGWAESPAGSAAPGLTTQYLRRGDQLRTYCGVHPRVAIRLVLSLQTLWHMAKCQQYINLNWAPVAPEDMLRQRVNLWRHFWGTQSHRPGPGCQAGIRCMRGEGYKGRHLCSALESNLRLAQTLPSGKA